MSEPASVAAVAEVLRTATAPALAALLRTTPASFAEAEDAVQEAVAIALEKWPAAGLPDRPVGWLLRVAQRRLIAHHRRDTARRRREELAASWAARPADPVPAADDSLLLLTLSCHPALTAISAVPLTLRAVGGLTTREIAAALLAPEATIAQRISRAKATIARAGATFGPVDERDLAERLPSILQVVYLIYTEGHTASAGADLQRTDLADDAVRIARLLHVACDHPEAAGLLALLLLTDARRAARVDADGALVPLDRQDRRRWDRAQISDGLRVLTAALSRGRPGAYQLQAAIAAVHDQAVDFASTDWPTVLRLYDRLLALGEHPVARLGRAVALAHVAGADAGLAAVEPLRTTLAAHHDLHAVRAHLLERRGDRTAARTAYLEAAALATNDAERRHLAAKADALAATD